MKYPQFNWEKGGGERGGVTPPAPALLAFGQIFKDDVNGFPSISHASGGPLRNNGDPKLCNRFNRP
jgi:hypothetical protein